jgi:hypothetical protein
MSATKQIAKQSKTATIETLQSWVVQLNATLSTLKNPMVRSSYEQRLRIVQDELKKRGVQ